MRFSVFLLSVVLLAACSQPAANAAVDTSPTPPATATPSPTATPTPDTDSPIRKVDFKNFRYEGPDDLPESFTLRDGEKSFVMGKEMGFSLGNVSYGDLTGDGNEEAILTIGVQTGGSAMPTLVFVYSIKHGRPKQIWKFATGDRADGGLREVFASSNELVVEVNGVTKWVNGTWKTTTPEENRRGACCATVYTRSKFRWNGKVFVVSGAPEILDIPERQ
jgi:hypothetical protein